jgi:hypothetical protein
MQRYGQESGQKGGQEGSEKDGQEGRLTKEYEGRQMNWQVVYRQMGTTTGSKIGRQHINEADRNRKIDR